MISTVPSAILPFNLLKEFCPKVYLSQQNVVEDIDNSYPDIVDEPNIQHRPNAMLIAWKKFHESFLAMDDYPFIRGSDKL
jgi:hypothetical protein